MPTGDGVSVTPDDLDSHAGHIETVAAALEQARQAGAATTSDADTYGQLCLIVPAMLGQLQDAVVNGIAAAEQSLSDSAERVRQAGTGYRDSDDRAATALRRAGRLQ